ncbi:AMMECR1 protein [Phytophthora cactorum]|nr:AMMECR1 protein [Phytophthora cactorum]
MSLSFITNPDPVVDTQHTLNLPQAGVICSKKNCYRPPTASSAPSVSFISRVGSARCLSAEVCQNRWLLHLARRWPSVPQRGLRKSAKEGGYCIAHGGGKRCREDGCSKSALAGGLCSAHGGGKRCSAPNCSRRRSRAACASLTAAGGDVKSPGAPKAPWVGTCASRTAAVAAAGKSAATRAPCAEARAPSCKPCKYAASFTPLRRLLFRASKQSAGVSEDGERRDGRVLLRHAAVALRRRHRAHAALRRASGISAIRDVGDRGAWRDSSARLHRHAVAHAAAEPARFHLQERTARSPLRSHRTSGAPPPALLRLAAHRLRGRRDDSRGNDYSATYLPQVAREQGWTHVETVTSLMRKAGYRRSVSEAMLRTVKVTRYRSSIHKLTYQQYLSVKQEILDSM